MDCARSAVRLNAVSVSIAYRRRREEMTALPEEIEAAEAEGCELLQLVAPLKIEVGDDGKAKALWVKKQMISYIKDGRPANKAANAEPVRLEADVIIVAIGQGIESYHLEDVDVTKRGTISVLDSEEISKMPGVFAGGDCVTGPATVIRAIAAGKVAAANIDEYLGFNHPIETIIDIPAPVPQDRPPCGRVKLRERPVEQRVSDFSFVEENMTEEEMKQETSRCLRCDRYGFGTFRGGRETRW